MKTVGIIAGLGPLAGAHFYRRLIELTPASVDQEHIPVILASDPRVPSRILHLQGEGESPGPQLVRMAKNLYEAGADFLVIPSTTTHMYHEEVARQVDIPVLHMIEEVAKDLTRYPVSTIGVLATTPTRTYRLYEEALARVGITMVYPDDASQEETMQIIAEVKEGKFHAASDIPARLAVLASGPWAQSIDGLLLACTEIPVVFPMQTDAIQVPVYSATDILARAVIRTAMDAQQPPT